MATSSCMRLRQRMKVDLPQPDGPMMAVTFFEAMSMSMPCRTSCGPNHALRPRTAYLGNALIDSSWEGMEGLFSRGPAPTRLHAVTQQDSQGVEHEHHE